MFVISGFVLFDLSWRRVGVKGLEVSSLKVLMPLIIKIKTWGCLCAIVKMLYSRFVGSFASSALAVFFVSLSRKRLSMMLDLYMSSTLSLVRHHKILLILLYSVCVPWLRSSIILCITVWEQFGCKTLIAVNLIEQVQFFFMVSEPGCINLLWISNFNF